MSKSRIWNEIQVSKGVITWFTSFCGEGDWNWNLGFVSVAEFEQIEISKENCSRIDSTGRSN